MGGSGAIIAMTRPPSRLPARQWSCRRLHSFIVPLQLSFEGDVLSFISTTTVFGTPLDVTLAELAIEAFFPADDATTRKLTATLGQ